MVVLSILHAVSGALLLLNTWAVETAGVKYGCWRAEGAESTRESACARRGRAGRARWTSRCSGRCARR